MTLSISKGVSLTAPRFGKIDPSLKAKVQGPSQFNAQLEKVKPSDIPALLRQLDVLSMPPIDLSKLRQRREDDFPGINKERMWYELTHKNDPIFFDKSDRDELDPETARQIHRFLVETELAQYVEGLTKARRSSPYLAADTEQRVTDLVTGIEQLQYYTLQPESALAKALLQFRQELYLPSLSQFKAYLNNPGS